MKTNRLLDEDMLAFDNLMQGNDDEGFDLLDELTDDLSAVERAALPKLIPKTPQPRKRKVSVFDLVEALETALGVQSRRKKYLTPDVQVSIPKKGIELTVVMQDVYEKVSKFFKAKNSAKSVSFEQLVPSDSKEDRVFTFIPLLHLENQAKVNMNQEAHFGDIMVSLAKSKKV